MRELGVVGRVRVHEEDDVSTLGLGLPEQFAERRDDRVVAGAVERAAATEADEHVDHDDDPAGLDGLAAGLLRLLTVHTGRIPRRGP